HSTGGHPRRHPLESVRQLRALSFELRGKATSFKLQRGGEFIAAQTQKAARQDDGRGLLRLILVLP
ncbi:MAG: hypothetical protein ACPH5V_07405, partial [Alcanivorax sp.]